MRSSARWILFSWFMGSGLLSGALPTVAQTVAQTSAGPRSETPNPGCPAPALSRLKRHKIAPGETLEKIADRHKLIPATLMGLNPVLREGKSPVGTEILIPPYNGIRVEVPADRRNWADLATAYGVRADVLFEVNGCRPVGQAIFVPGVNWSPLAASGQAAPRTPSPQARALIGYPLPAIAPVALGYGWQIYPNTQQVAFHGGLDLVAKVGTPVQAAADGTVAFVGQQEGYGYLVVINHAQGLQTRYAHLSAISVKTGQTVKRGDRIGAVGQTGAPSSSVAHLHFEIRSNSSLGWVAEDPNPYVQPLQGKQP